LTGFEAIAHHNGWVMAALGATIVFCGLAVLATVISQLPRIFSLLEKKPPVRTEAQPAAQPAPAPEKIETAKEVAPGAEGMAEAYQPLIEELMDPFQLADLYQLARAHDLPHPHLSLSALQRAGVLVPQGEGAFTWRPQTAPSPETSNIQEN
jgi:hypothetical protein